MNFVIATNKPKRFEAVRITRENINDIRDWSDGRCQPRIDTDLPSDENPCGINCAARKGIEIAKIGDWVVRDESGLFFTLTDAEFMDGFNVQIDCASDGK